MSLRLKVLIGLFASLAAAAWTWSNRGDLGLTLTGRYLAESDPAVFVEFLPAGVARSNIRTKQEAEDCRWSISSDDGDIHVYSEAPGRSFRWYAYPMAKAPLNHRRLGFQDTADLNIKLRFRRAD